MATINVNNGINTSDITWDINTPPVGIQKFEIVIESPDIVLGETFDITIASLPNFVTYNESAGPLPVQISDVLTNVTLEFEIDQALVEGSQALRLSDDLIFTITNELAVETQYIIILTASATGIYQFIQDTKAALEALELEYTTHTNALPAGADAFPVLRAQVDDLIALQNSYISDKDFSASLNIVERGLETNLTKTRALETLTNSITASLNSLSLRFKRYAADSESIRATAAVIPTASEKAALVGTSGTPSITNPFVTTEDPRLIDSRDPNLHVATHELGGTDELAHSSLAGDIGTLTHTELETAINANLTAIGVNTTDISTLVGRADALETWQAQLDLDTLPVGASFAKLSLVEYARLVSQDVYDALQVTGANGTNKFLSSSDAAAIYQVIGSYLTSSYFSAIDKDLIPDGSGTRNLGSAANPWGELHISENTIYVGGKALGLVGGELALDGVKIVNEDTVVDEINANADVIAAKFHADSVHDWDLIAGSTAELDGISAASIAALIGHNHNSSYYTKTELDSASSASTGIFNRFAVKSALSSGTQPVAWSGLTGIPTLADPRFRGVVNEYDNLPTSGLSDGDFFLVKTNPTSSTLAGAYIAVSPGAGVRSLIYRSLFSPGAMLHANFSDLSSDHHTQYFNQDRLNDHLFNAGTIASIKSSLGIINSGSGSIITTTERNNISNANAHVNHRNNPHQVTAYQVGAIRDIARAVNFSHINFGTGASQVSTDSIPEGANKFVTALEKDNINDIVSHLADTSEHLSPIERSELFGLGSTESHYHAADRDLANSIGTLPANRITGLEQQVLALSQIVTLISKSHDENHALASHSDVTVTGGQLTALKNAHGTVIYDAHNAQFSPAGGYNGTSNRVARQDHNHAGFLERSEFLTLQAAGASIQIDWSNISNIPSTVGDTRTFENMTQLNAADPLVVGEQVVVTDYNGSGDWGVFIAGDDSSWTLLSSKNMGLSYAPATHNHDSVYQKISTIQSDMTTVINNHFSNPLYSGQTVSTSDRNAWNGAVSTLGSHVANSTHLTVTDRTNYDIAYVHSQTAGVHLTSDQQAKVAAWDASVSAVSITGGGLTKTLEDWIDALAGGSSLSLANLSDWPTAPAATGANLGLLMDGSDADGLHHHDSEYSALGHTHVMADITDADSEMGAFGYFKQADVVNLFTNVAPVITTSHIAEGTKLFLNEGNLASMASYQSVQSHINDQETDRKHLSQGERAALTGGLISTTYLHNHNGMHYTQDADITIGVHRTSIANSADVGQPGLVKAKYLAATAAAPVAGNSSGEIGEFRVGNTHAFFKCPDGTWRKIALQSL